MKKYGIESATLMLFSNDRSISETELLDYYRSIIQNNYSEESAIKDDVKDPGYGELFLTNLQTSAESECSEERESFTKNLYSHERRPTKINTQTVLSSDNEECPTGKFKQFFKIIFISVLTYFRG